MMEECLCLERQSRDNYEHIVEQVNSLIPRPFPLQPGNEATKQINCILEALHGHYLVFALDTNSECALYI